MRTFLSSKKIKVIFVFFIGLKGDIDIFLIV
jgi:hypothetical protein